MSFQIAIKPTRRAAARLVADVRRRLQQALEDEGVSQAAIAEKIGVGRSVVNRQIKGHADLSLSRIGEIAEVLGYDADFVMLKRSEASGANGGARMNITVNPESHKFSAGVTMDLTKGYFKVSGNSSK